MERPAAPGTSTTANCPILQDSLIDPNRNAVNFLRGIVIIGAGDIDRVAAAEKSISRHFTNYQMYQDAGAVLEVAGCLLIMAVTPTHDGWSVLLLTGDTRRASAAFSTVLGQ